MLKYKILVVIYLISVLSSTIANSMGLDVQTFYRVPFLGIRWIDIGILLVIAGYIQNALSKNKTILNSSGVVSFSFIYLIFELVQLISSWMVIDTQTQISFFLATLSFFVIIDLSTFKISSSQIIQFLKQYAFWGAVIVIISNLYLFYSFLTGHVVYQDLDIRVAIDVVGTKETVSTSVLTPFVYGFSIYFVQKKIKFIERVVFITALASIYVTLVTAFHRGTLFMVFVLSLYAVVSSKKAQQAFGKVIGLAFLLGICYFIFGSSLKEKGYDPIEKISETAKFATDINDDNWDKGRSGPQEYAINAWKQNLWMGVGYDALSNYGLPEDYSTAHNGIITSLFHRGIIGTSLLLIILFALYRDSVKLWPILKYEVEEAGDMMKILVVVSFLWFVPFITQEVLWEKYSLSVQFVYMGLIVNYYRQKRIN